MWRIGGASVGSQSYRVGDHFVKLLQPAGSLGAPAWLWGSALDYLFTAERIASALGSAGVPIEPLVPNVRGEHVTTLDVGQTGFAQAYVQAYVEGAFFDGTPEQLERCLPRLLAIGPALRAVRPAASQRRMYRQWRPVEVHREVRAILLERRGRGLDDFDRLVLDHLPLHEEVVRGYDARRFESETLHHYDLHPHNLLFRSGELRGILDFGGFQAVPDEVAIGFALYKLGRKGVSLGRLSVIDFRRVVGPHADLGVLAPYARLEVARRATLVLRLHYLEANRVWDRDVRKQLVGPLEVDALFVS